MTVRRIITFSAAGLLLAAVALRAQDPAPARNGPGAPFKGYLNLRYAYVGSSAASNILNGFRLSGYFRVSALKDKIVLRYRSRHWLDFSHPKDSVLESPYENKHILQTVALETNGLLFRGFKTALGRFLPDLDYASTPVVDGGAVAFERGGVTVGAVLGRMVDLWSGAEKGTDLFAAAQVRYGDSRLGLSAGFNSGRFFGLRQKEIPAGLNYAFTDSLRAEAYGSYDLVAKTLARAGLSLSWHADSASISLLASEWRNPFDQLYLLDKARGLGTWGLYATEVPVLYKDVRVSGSWSSRGWGLRGSFGLMAGVRSGWTASAAAVLPPLAGMRLSVGVQAMKTDLIEFYSLDAGGEGQVGPLSLKLQTQARFYQWRPRASGFRNVDDFTELSLEYPIGRHVFLSAAGGGYIRRLGNEKFKPQAELRLIVRL